MFLVLIKRRKIIFKIKLPPNCCANSSLDIPSSLSQAETILYRESYFAFPKDADEPPPDGAPDDIMEFERPIARRKKV